MSTIPELERILYFPGELLTADDLTTADSNNRALRWLHNRTLHHWGIAIGLDVLGQRGATSVTVNPGYANDILGREIILSSPLQLPIPAVSGGANGSPATYYLVADYVDDANQTVEEQRAAVACSAGGSVRLSNDPAILWKTATQLTFGVDVVLAKATIQNCVLSQNVSGAVRRYAFAEMAPIYKAGLIEATNITWVSWTLAGTNIGFTAAIDTSAAKFHSTPAYTAQVVGPRTLASEGIVANDFVSLADESAKGFTLQVALPPISAIVNPASLTDAISGPKLIAQLGWHISWMGVER